MSQICDLGPAAPDGTCVPVGTNGRNWRVRGRSAWYRVDAEAGECSCGDFVHRRATQRTACRHLRALSSYLMVSELVKDLDAREAIQKREPLPSDTELRRIFT